MQPAPLAPGLEGLAKVLAAAQGSARAVGSREYEEDLHLRAVDYIGQPDGGRGGSRC